MNETAMEILNKILIFLIIIASVLAGYYINQIHTYNELVLKNTELIKAYIKLQDYERASCLCSQTQDYLKFIATFNPVFFSIETDIPKLDKICEEVYYYNLNLPNQTIVIPK